ALNQMREKQRENGEKIRYDGTWRPEPGKTLPAPPAGISPVIRFKNPQTGVVQWNDLVKGPISISNEELDDLVLARQDGSPTYNFCVVVDDWEMEITHVIRGDDHINNTPRQMNILAALGATLPEYGHIPMILGPDGEKLSKRHGAVSVVQYHEEGFLPDAMVNYLARLGWSHGDHEYFSREQFVQWFDGSNLSRSAAQFDPEKLKWLNAQYMKQADPVDLLGDLTHRLNKIGINPHQPSNPALAEVLNVVLERASTLVELRDEAALFYREPTGFEAELHTMLDAETREALQAFCARLPHIEWSATELSGLIKETIKAHGLKMPRLAMPLRLLLTGQKQTPSIDKVMALLGPETVQRRVAHGLAL
ncbi:MAG: glutamate--tRNA ligase, partial [Limnobacter sp.]|nr:glutamate--tRNA ligase [Limnobacter sp.]